MRHRNLRPKLASVNLECPRDPRNIYDGLRQEIPESQCLWHLRPTYLGPWALEESGSVLHRVSDPVHFFGGNPKP